MVKNAILVVCGVIKVAEGVLVFRRGESSSSSGFWEFPGGKIEKGETAIIALKRELKEELEINVTVGDFLMENQIELRDKIIVLKSYWIDSFIGEIQLNVHDKMEVSSKDDLCKWRWLPADKEIVKALGRIL